MKCIYNINDCFILQVMELDTSVESLVYEECLTGEEAWVEEEELRGDEEEAWEEQVEDDRKLEEEIRKSEKDKSDGPPAICYVYYIYVIN